MGPCTSDNSSTIHSSPAVTLHLFPFKFSSQTEAAALLSRCPLAAMIFCICVCACVMWSACAPHSLLHGRLHVETSAALV